jgi:uncharacterized protein
VPVSRIRPRAHRIPPDMQVSELWRYPVKSMAGETLPEAELRVDGILGDRLIHVEDGHGRVLTARSHPRLLGLRGTLGADGTALVNDLPWDAPETAAAVRRAAGSGAKLIRYEGPERFDVLPLLVATDGAVAALGVDRRRLRPNILIAGVEGLAERLWSGAQLRIGDAVIAVEKLRARCVMTTYDPDTQAQDLGVLKRIVTDFGGRLALDCAVVEGGRLFVGAPVTLLPAK